MEDIEENGLELYRHKAVTICNIRGAGRIVGVIEELSAKDIYELGKEVGPFSIASCNRMDRVHLSVKKQPRVHTTVSLYTLKIYSRFRMLVG